MLLEEQQNYSSSQTMHRSFAVTMSVAKKKKQKTKHIWLAANFSEQTLRSGHHLFVLKWENEVVRFSAVRFPQMFGRLL